MDNVELRFQEFINTVELMREAQRAYFKNRTKENLESAKKLERLVDELIESSKSIQTTIF